MLDGFIPLPNANVVGANYTANGIQKMDEDAFAIRTDHSLTSKDRVSVRYAMTISASSILSTSFLPPPHCPRFPFQTPSAGNRWQSRTHTSFGSSGANEFRFGPNRQRNPIPNATEIDPASIGLPNGVIQNEFGRGLPIIRVTGFGGSGSQPLNDNLGASTTYRTMFQFIDNISVNYKQHSTVLNSAEKSAARTPTKANIAPCAARSISAGAQRPDQSNSSRQRRRGRVSGLPARIAGANNHQFSQSDAQFPHDGLHRLRAGRMAREQSFGLEPGLTIRD